MSRRMAHSRRTHHSLDVLFRFAKRTKSRASQNKLGRPNSAGAFVEPATSRSAAPDGRIAWQILLAAPRLRAKSFQLATPRYRQTTNFERTNRVTPSGLPGWVSQRSASLGALSLIFWTLIIVAAVKIRAFDHESRQPRRRRHSRLAGACSRIGTKRAFARHPCPPRPRRCRIILRRQPLALFLFQKHRQRGSTPASQCRCLRENPFFRMVLDWGLFHSCCCPRSHEYLADRTPIAAGASRQRGGAISFFPRHL